MNLIDYNQTMEAMDKERQLLLNREQYEAENVLVHHAINVVSELPIIRQPEIVRCKDCKWNSGSRNSPYCQTMSKGHEPDWFCADGRKKEE